MPRINFGIRQFAALMCATTLAWDYFRAPEVIEQFSIWTLGLHFIYFQLPPKSRALALFHSTSFIGSNVMLASYLFLLMHKTTLEADHMEQWDVSYQTIIVRAFLIHAMPLLFHSLDISFNQDLIVSSYQSKPRKVMYVWSFISYGSLGLLFDMVFPEGEETSSIPGLEKKAFVLRNRVVSLFVTIFAISLLYSMVLKRAYYRKARSRSIWPEAMSQYTSASARFALSITTVHISFCFLYNCSTLGDVMWCNMFNLIQMNPSQTASRFLSTRSCTCLNNP